MTTNDDMTPRQPDENEPLEQRSCDELDLVDETVARITDVEVDEQLRKVLRRSGYRGQLTISCGQFVGPWKQNAEHWADLVGFSGSLEAAIAAARGAASDIIADAQLTAKTASDELRRTQEAVTEARQQAEQMVADARTEADKALEQAVKMIRNAGEQAAQIISDAHKEAENIIETAQNQQVQAGWAKPGAALEISRPPAEPPIAEVAAFGDCADYTFPRSDDCTGNKARANQYLADRTGHSDVERVRGHMSIVLEHPAYSSPGVTRWLLPSSNGWLLPSSNVGWLQTPTPKNDGWYQMPTLEGSELAIIFELGVNYCRDSLLIAGRPGMVSALCQQAGRAWRSGWAADTELRALAAAGDEAELLALRGDLKGLRALAAAGDEAAAMRLAELLAQRGDLDGLRALAAAGDEAAAMRLWNLALAAR